MKILIRFLCLALVICMCFACVACDTTETNSDIKDDSVVFIKKPKLF